MKSMSSTAMMECGIGCVLVVEAGREWRPMLCVDNWDSAAKVWDIDYIHVIELLLQSPGAKKGGGTAPTANAPTLCLVTYPVMEGKVTLESAIVHVVIVIVEQDG